MALVVKDRVKETTTTTGTANLSLGGAVFGFQTFSVIGDGNTTYYGIYDSSTGDWEVGIGTYTASGPTLSRDTVLESSNSGSKVVFGAGNKDVYVTYPAERSVYLSAAGLAVDVLDIGTLGTSTANISTANITAGTVSTTPTSSNDLVNKSYVDGIAAQGISYHQPVKYEVPNTTGNLNATYSNGTGGVGATLTNAGTKEAFAPDGPTAQVGDRILVYNQTNAFENGIYEVTTVGTPDPGGTNWVLTRTADADSYGTKDPNALGAGDAFYVTSGNTGAGETYVCNTAGTITFGTTAITFAQVSSAQVYSAGTGLTLSNLQFSITPVGTAGTYGSASQVPVFVTNASGQVTSVTNTGIAITSSAVSGLAPSATTDTTNASNITSGTLDSARLSGSYTGITGVGTLTAGTWTATAIGAAYGGTGQTTYTVGDLLYADGTTSLAKLSDVVAGNALLSGGIGTAPAWGKVGLQTHIDGTLQAVNGGTGLTSPGASGNVLTSNGTTWTSSALPPGGITYVYKIANYTASNNEGVLANTSGGAFTVTLPASPSVGNQVVVADAGGLWGTNNLTVGRNGSTIGDLAQDLICDINGASVQLVYDGTTWEVYAQVGGNGGTAVTLDGVQTLTNKTISGANNTLTNIPLATAVTGTLPTTNGGTGLTSFTANRVFYASSSSAIAQSANLTFDGFNFGVGVTPSAWNSNARAIQISTKTAVFENVLGNTFYANNLFQNASGQFAYLGNGAASFYTQNSGDHFWESAVSGTAGNTASFSRLMTLSASGNIGLGVAPSSWVSRKAIEVNRFAILGDSANGGAIAANSYFNGSSWIYTNSDFASNYTQTSGEHQWFTAPSGTSGNTFSFTQVMTLNASGNLGIGTSSPSVRLHAANNGSGEADVARFSRTNGADLHFLDIGVNPDTNFVTFDSSGSSSGGYTFRSGGTDRAILDSSGNLGLGVTPPASDSKGLFVTNQNSVIGSTSSGSSFTANTYVGGGSFRYVSSAVATMYQQFAGAHAWYIAPSGTAGNAISFTQAMTLDASGNLGLGATSITALGSGYTTQAVQGANGAGFRLYQSTNERGRFYVASTAAYLESVTSIPLVFSTDSTERARITSNGNLLVGSTGEDTTSTRLVLRSSAESGSAAPIFSTINANAGARQLSVFHSGANLGIYNARTGADLLLGANNTERARITSDGDLLVNNTTNTLVNGYASQMTLVYTGGGAKYGFALRPNTDNTTAITFCRADGLAVVGTITQTSSATAYNTSSDYRLKDNPQPLTGSGDFIDALKPKTWTWKADGTKGVGFIAHEVQEVSPGSVTGEKDGEQMQAMEYGSAEFIANIIAELQSLRARMAALESKGV